MGAGLSKRQRNQRIYTRLQSVKRELIRAGVPTLYKGGQLFFNDITNLNGGFNVSYKWIGASNGECAATCVIHIQPPDPVLHAENYGGWCTDKANDGTYEKGVARLKELFGGQIQIAREKNIPIPTWNAARECLEVGG